MTRLRLAALFAALAVGMVQPAQAAERTISVRGQARLEVPPDVATVSVGVTTRAQQATVALDMNSAAAQRVIEHARRFGVADDDIRTSSVSLSEDFKNKRSPDGAIAPAPDGYVATNMVTVRLRDLSRMGAFMRDVVDQGANRIAGVGFGLANPDRLADELRREAVQDARRKAVLLAEAGGAKLGRVVSITHPPRSGAVQPLEAADLPRQRMMSSAVPIAAGAIALSAEVEMTWALE